MSVLFEVVEGERLVEALYAKPAFELLRDSTRLFELIYARFATNGLLAADMRIESGEGSFGDAHLQYAVRSARTSVRVYVSKTSVSTRLERFINGADSVVAGSALELVVEAGSGLEYDQYSVAVTAHGRLFETNASEYLSSFVKNVPKLGQLSSSGCVFYYGPDGNALSSSVTLDNSTIVEDGVFVATRVNFDGQQVPVEAIMDRIDAHTSSVLDAVGLRVEGG